MEKYLIHSNELHLIDKAKIHQAVEKMVESLDMAAGSTSCGDLFYRLGKKKKDEPTSGHNRCDRRDRRRVRRVLTS